MKKMTKEEYFKTFRNQGHVEKLKKVERKFETYKNEADNITELTIYGVIGNSWWDDSVSASDIDEALQSITGDIVINLNSPGGDAFDGIAIYNRLKKHEGNVTINVDGWACSAASVIACAADVLNMGLGAMLMIHEASTIVWGSKTDMRKEADVLENLEEGIIDIYMTKVNVTREEIKEMVNSETWFSAQKAVEIGFAVKADDSNSNSEDKVQNTTLSADDKQEILSELQSILKPNNKKEEPDEATGKAATRRKGFFF